MGRATQGVRVMNLADNERLVSIARLAEEDVADDELGRVPSSSPPEGDVPEESVTDASPPTEDDPSED